MAVASVQFEGFNEQRRRGNHDESPPAGLLGELSRAAHHLIDDIDALVGVVATRVAGALGDICAISLVSADGRSIDLTTAHAGDPDIEAAARLALGLSRSRIDESTDGDVLRSRESLFVPEVRGNDRAAVILDGFSVHSLITVPLRVRDRVLGTITVARVRPGDPYRIEDVRLLEEVADLAALAVDDARLFERQAESDDIAQRARQVERLAATGQLAAGLAHDVSNVVTVIKLYAELLEADTVFDAIGRDRLHAIRAQAERAVSLAWQVLDTAHRQPLEARDVDVGPFLEEFAGVIAPLLRRGVTLTVWTDGSEGADARRVRADPTRLHQIMTNVVANAAQALPDGGAIMIRAGSRHADDRGRPGPWVHVEVMDQGCGIAPDVLPRVFEPFFSTKPEGRGTGLGLSQVRALMAQHGGTVTIRSEPGEGTVVSLLFPSAADDPASGVPTAGGGAGDTPAVGRGELVLVVEDDASLRTALVDALASFGFKPDAVCDGDEALAWLDLHGDLVGAVVSDVAMPGLGGEGLARRMATAWPTVPVVLTTTFGSGEGAGTAGVHRLSKPFSAEQLAAVLRVAMA